ncbi:UNVERIFIED_CONTAM: hypothetical protein Sradi_3210300 [Sesamum radiatum]|uniref:Uncharacterized protein n=1 Tax=Sesamum radiatum TaxID=300843 RepID=A0AAW2RG92_SESRA
MKANKASYVSCIGAFWGGTLGGGRSTWGEGEACSWGGMTSPLSEVCSWGDDCSRGGA